jgi:methylated-DNA-[protein]-cysteine S-methyltransferase
MAEQGATSFETAIGRCGIAWGERGIRAVPLPGRPAPAGREAAPPPALQLVIDGIKALLRGEPRDLSGVALDMERVPSFQRRVYEAARGIPPGATLTYGELAARIGAPGEAREVGRALARNPFAIVVPCHRVVAAGGRPGGFSAPGGVAMKLRLLAIEGARASDQPELFGPGGAIG